MKHIINRISKIIFIFLVSCAQKEPCEDVVIKTFDCFTATIEGSKETKAHLEGKGGVKWDIGDQIVVFTDIDDSAIFTFGEDGKFHGNPISGHQFYAYYPTDIRQSSNDNPLLLSFNVQTNTFRIPMVAHSDADKFEFRQIGGILHLNVQWTEPINGITLRGNRQEILGGTAYVDLSEDIPSLYINKTDAGPHYESQYIDLTLLDIENREDVYFFLPVMSFSNGFTIIVDSASQRYEKSTFKAVSIPRATMKSFELDINTDIVEGINKDRDALIAFYHALHGDEWTVKTNWCTDAPLETWYGVYINEVGRVEEINLCNNNLKGTLPPEIGNLKYLSSLTLTTNQIESPLPEEISRLIHLSCLGLENNHLTGPFPEQLRYLKNLSTLALTGARERYGEEEYFLSGEIPNWISELTQLWNLDISYNHFSGELPETISKLGNLKKLCLEFNDFSGQLPDISGMPTLYSVKLNDCFFSGSVPSSYSVYMDKPQISWGGFPYTFNRMINIGGNCLSGSLPNSIVNHEYFSEFADGLLVKQRPGYKLELDDTKVPACRHTYDTFSGEKINLGELYKDAEYTMIVRWNERNESEVLRYLALSKKYKEYGLQTVWAYACGVNQDGESFIRKSGLDETGIHIIECQELFSMERDHAVWMINGETFLIPFVEIVDKNGYVIFIDDSIAQEFQGKEVRYYDVYSFSNRSRNLESYLAGLFNEKLYESTDFSSDGQVYQLQASKKGYGINVVMMGDAFTDRLIADGTYKAVMEKAANALFSEEPYKSHKDYFNVYYIDVVSKNEEYYGETALSTWYGNGTAVGGDNEKVFQYASTVLSDEQLDDALLIVMMNRDFYAGTCYMYNPKSGDYGSGASVSYFPTSSDIATFNGLVSHEAGGHGFAKLADEYAYEYKGAMPEDEKQQINVNVPFGWFKNADFTGDPLEVKWAQFIADNRYDDENIGCYEGAFTYWTGAWRPTDASIMRYNTGGFNAPSRYAIWYRIHKLAYGDEWQGTYEDFVEYDKVNRTPAAVARRKQQRRNFVEKDFEPLAPPVIINQDWRDALRSRP